MTALLEHTPWTLADLTEQEFDRVTEALEQLDHPRAKWLIEVVWAVSETGDGIYDRDNLELLDTCPYTHAHTRHWCGHLLCRDA
jgi:hypothetical protein